MENRNQVTHELNLMALNRCHYFHESTTLFKWRSSFLFSEREVDPLKSPIYPGVPNIVSILFTNN